MISYSQRLAVLISDRVGRQNSSPGSALTRFTASEGALLRIGQGDGFGRVLAAADQPVLHGVILLTAGVFHTRVQKEGPDAQQVAIVGERVEHFAKVRDHVAVMELPAGEFPSDSTPLGLVGVQAALGQPVPDPAFADTEKVGNLTHREGVTEFAFLIDRVRDPGLDERLRVGGGDPAVLAQKGHFVG